MKQKKYSVSLYILLKVMEAVKIIILDLSFALLVYSNTAFSIKNGTLIHPMILVFIALTATHQSKIVSNPFSHFS
jgi:hypothetical protein